MLDCRSGRSPTRLIGALALTAALGACSSKTVTEPSRSATEQLLVSAAVDNAAEQLAERLPLEGRLFLKPMNFEGSDGDYAVGAVRDALLRQGARLADVREAADYILEVRTGALSIDSAKVLVGIPSITLPLIQGLSTPEIALFSEDLNQGVVKLAGTAYDPQSGRLIASSGPAFGFSHQAEWTALLVVSWTTSDLRADTARPAPAPWD